MKPEDTKAIRQQALANTIRRAAEELNGLINHACDSGLRVEIRTVSVGVHGDAHPREIVQMIVERVERL